MKVINHQLTEGFTVTHHFLLPILGFQHLRMMEALTIQTGWWFGTFFIFHNIWDNPSHWLIFFRGVETANLVLVEPINL